MKTHETVRLMTDGQRSDIIATMVTAIPELTFDEAQKGVIGNKGDFVADIRKVFQRYRKMVFAIPADGEEFELTLEPIDPMDMVRSDGYDATDWEFTGSQITAPQTRRFKLVRVGYCRNLDGVRDKLTAHGKPPEGQWREAFKKAFPRNDGKGPIGFSDPSWVNPNGDIDFPILNENGESWNSNFNWADNDRNDNWRWLVECNCFHSLLLKAGFSFLNCFSQPPSMRPVSSSFSESMIYFLLSKAFISQAI